MTQKEKFENIYYTKNIKENTFTTQNIETLYLNGWYCPVFE